MTETRSLREIAGEIYRDWNSQGKGVNYAAMPYLRAMRQLDTINDSYGLDSANTTVLYFLANASTWHGETAKRVKKELQYMVKQNRRM